MNIIHFILMMIVMAVGTVFAQEDKFRLFKFTKVADNLKFPEGPAWDGKENLYVSNCYGDWILKIREDKNEIFVSSPTSPTVFGNTNGMTVYMDGSIYACDFGQGAIVKFSPEGKCDTVVSGYLGRRFNRPNDLAFDANGNLFFTDPKSYDKDTLDGVVYMISKKDGKVKPVYYGMGFPNGIAFSPDAKYAFVCESALHRILKFSINEDGSFINPVVFADMPGGDPDGIAFDIEGNLYAAHFGGGAIYVFNPEGELKYKIKTPGKKPSNLEFAGNDMKTLYITEDETNSVYKTKVDIPGLSLFSSPEKN